MVDNHIGGSADDATIYAVNHRLLSLPYLK